MRELVRRMRALEHHVHDVTAERRQEFAGGVAYSTPALPAVRDLNFLRLDRPCEALAAEADRLQAHLSHRHVLVEDAALVERFGAGLRERGFGEHRLVALAREPGGALDPDVHELGYDELRPLRARNLGEDALDDAVIGQLVAAGALAERAGGRWLALFDAGTPVAHCVVYSRDGLAQIEDIATLPSHQRRGIARRLVSHALALVAEDHDAVFLIADADDWPIAFYERLGFRRIEERCDYLLLIARA